MGFKKRFSYFLKHLWYKYIDKSKGDYHRFLSAHLNLATAHDSEDTKRVGEVIIPPLGRHIWAREWVEDVVNMPFEMIEIPVPANFEACLDASLGNVFLTPRKIGNYHGQVIFDVDHPYTDYIKNR